MKTKVEQRHREAAVAAMFPSAGDESWMAHWARHSPTWIESRAEEDFPAARVAQALADAEQRGAESLAASQPRQGGADGREVEIRAHEARALLQRLVRRVRARGTTAGSEALDKCASQVADYLQRTHDPKSILRDVPAESRQQQTWVPCSERLPEPNVDVLVRNERGWIRVGYLVPELPGDWYPGRWHVRHTTHWMPLPPPPAEVTP